MLIISFLPVAVLLYYIYKCDYKPEPFKMIARGLLYGVCSVVLVVILHCIFAAFGFEDYFYGEGRTIVSQFLRAFVAAAIPEECAKLLMLHLLLRKNKYFDEHIDGIVYAACVGLGFAGLENVTYVYGSEDWLYTGIARAISAVPGHFMMGIAMGYYYSLFRFNVEGRKREWAVKMLLIPIIFHGVYDAMLMIAPMVGPLLVVILLIGVIFWLNKMRKFSKEKITELRRRDGFAG